MNGACGRRRAGWRWAGLAVLACALQPAASPPAAPPVPPAWRVSGLVGSPVPLRTYSLAGATVDRALGDLVAQAARGWTVRRHDELGAAELVRGTERWVVLISPGVRPLEQRAVVWRGGWSEPNEAKGATP